MHTSRVLFSRGWLNMEESGPLRLRFQVQEFLRHFGALIPDRSPCGQALPISQAHTLHILGESPGLTMRELASRLALDPSTVSRLVDAMVSRGWVVKEADAADRRSWRLALSTTGHETWLHLNTASLTKFADLWERISGEDRQAVERALQLLVVAAHAQATEQGGNQQHGA